MMKMKVRRCGEESKVMDNAVVNREAWNDAVAMRERLGTVWWQRVCVLEQCGGNERKAWNGVVAKSVCWNDAVVRKEKLRMMLRRRERDSERC